MSKIQPIELKFWLVVLIVVASMIYAHYAPVNIDNNVSSGSGECTNASSNSEGELSKKYDFNRLDIIKLRLSDYKSDQKRLTTNLILQITLILVGLLIIIQKQNEYEIPFLKIDVPTSWLFYIVPSGLLFFWVEFGFITDKLIENRAEAWSLLSSYGAPNNDQLLKNTARLYEDSGYVDGWFVNFRSSEHVIDDTSKIAAKIFFGLFYGAILGAGHAVILAVLQIGSYRYQSVASSKSRILKPVISSLPFITLGLIILSHYVYRYSGKNNNWFQMVIASSMLIFLYFIYKFSTRTDSERV